MPRADDEDYETYRIDAIESQGLDYDDHVFNVLWEQREADRESLIALLYYTTGEEWEDVEEWLAYEDQ